MERICSLVNQFIWPAHVCGSDPYFNMSSHLFGTLVNLSTRLFSEVVSLTSTTRLYSSINCCMFANILRTHISLAAFVLPGLSHLVSISTSICLRGRFFTVSCHPFVNILARPFIIPVTARSHPQAGKYPTNFPQMDNTLCRVSVTGSSGNEFPCFHRNVFALNPDFELQYNGSIS